MTTTRKPDEIVMSRMTNEQLVRVGGRYGIVMTISLAAILAAFVAGVWIDWRWLPMILPLGFVLLGSYGVPARYQAEIDRRRASPGTELVAAERVRQISVEGWTPEHDAQHTAGELTSAAISYAAFARGMVAGPLARADRQLLHDQAMDSWPFDGGFKPEDDDPIRNLVKAAALVVAEIDRLQRRAES